MRFKQGEKVDKLFYIHNTTTGERVATTDVVGVLWEVKTGRVISRYQNPEDLGNNVHKFTIPPADTRKCPIGVELWFDVYVGNIVKIFSGKFGTAQYSPLKDEHTQ